MAMNVSITLTLQDQFTNRINGIINSLNQLKAAAAGLNKAFSAQSLGSGFTGLNRQVTTLNANMQRLAQTASQVQRSLGSAMVGGGMSGQGQLATMRQMLQLQQQMLANQNRLNAAQTRGSGSGGGWFGDRRGFHPNASLIDRGQNRAVNFISSVASEGTFSLDKVRTRLRMFGRPQSDIDMIERAAVEMGREYGELSRADRLETFGEMLGQFQTAKEAVDVSRELFDIQRFNIFQGDTVEKARGGMLSLVRTVGLRGLLTDNESGTANIEGLKNTLEIYKRARVIGGSDITVDQFFQLVKYMKTTGQTINDRSLLKATIGSPDLRASTFGNQLEMLVKNLTGGATKEAMANQVKAGWITGGIERDNASGPNKFKWRSTKDQDALRADPIGWVENNVIGYLDKEFKKDGKSRGYLDASSAEIASKLRPMISHSGAFNQINTIVNQWREWQNQVENAYKAKVSRKDMTGFKDESLWFSWQLFRGQIKNVFESLSENVKVVAIPAFQRFGKVLSWVADLIDPHSGNPAASMGLMAGGAMGAWMLLSRLMRSANPIGRVLLGGATGGLAGGLETGLMGAMMGALMGRGGGAVASAATGGLIARFLPALIGGVARMSLIGLGASAVASIVQGWDSKKGALENISAGLTKFLDDTVGAIKKLLGIKDAQAEEKPTVGSHGQSRPQTWGEWMDSELLKPLRSKNDGGTWGTNSDGFKDFKAPGVDDWRDPSGQGYGSFFGTMRRWGGYLHELIFPSAHGSELRRPSFGMDGGTDVPGLFLGSHPLTSAGMNKPAAGDLGTQIKSAADEAAAQIRSAGGTLAGAITAVAGQVSSAGNAISAAAATVGAAAKGTLGNQSRSTLGDGVKT